MNSIELKNKHAIVFDMDGVLIDTEKYLTKFWCMAAKEFGFDMTLEHAYSIRSLSGKFGEERLQQIFGKSFDYEAVRSRRKEIMNEWLSEHGIEAKTGVFEALKILKESGYLLAIATSTDSERAKKYLEEIDIYHLFDKVVCANMVKKGKPEPDIYLFATSEIGEKPEDCIAIEDSYNGILSAYRANMSVVMIPDITPLTDNEEPMLAGCFDNLMELAMFMKK